MIMKRLFMFSLLTVGLSVALLAKNTTQTVAQVTEPVSLTEAVDYHITGTQPFSTTGSIDIINTDNAVVIIDNLKPSKAKAYLSYIKINGVTAKDGSNCQLKLYNRGAIILPYGGSTFRPLTVFDGANFEGESFNALTEGHSGGYMKNVPTAWNNRIQSFKLKRGYMVTFALKKGGRGYSRCFIAADADLEVTLPALMAGRISSYRIFKWYDVTKVALANDTRADAVDKLNVTSCYSFGKGESRLPDAECVPHHIYEDWPSSADCGNQNYSCHLKTNNEPGNSADDRPQDVATILNNWENLMRTGMRLCSPSSHDGSLGHLRQCLDSIDARGWRCDIIDLHCYWPESSFNTWSFYDQWANHYGRPIWISEWVWGASWNSNGAFANGVTEAQNRDAVKRITTNLNNWDCIERYFYWNSERDPSRIYKDGRLTAAGEYYASINSGLAYNNYKNYVPKAPPAYAVNDLSTTFNVKYQICELKWTNRNGDLATTVSLQRRIDDSAWTTIKEWTGSELEDETAMSYKDNIDSPGAYAYRIVEKLYNNSTKTSNIAYNVLALTQGTDAIQFGSINANVDDESFVYFKSPFDEENEPVVIFGSVNNKNNSAGLVDNLVSVSKVNNAYTYFRYKAMKWAHDADVTTNAKITSNFIVAKPGRGKLGKLNYEAGYASNGETSYLGFTPTEVRFAQPFETVPVVMVTPIKSSGNNPVMWRVWDVTTEGFKVELMYESNITTGKTACRMGYLAIEEGQGTDGEAMLYTVGKKEFTFKASAQSLEYPREFEEPNLLVQLQTFNHEASAILRVGLSSTPTQNSLVYMQVDKSNTAMTLSSTRSATETVGYILISNATEEDLANDEPDAVRDVESSSRTLNIYDLSGRHSLGVGRGVYIVDGKKLVVK